MKIAIVYGRMPLPMTRADQMTVAHLISYLAARGHQLDLFTLDTGEPVTETQRAWLAQKCHRLFIAQQSRLASIIGAGLAVIAGRPMQVGWFTNRLQIAQVRGAMQREDYDIIYTYYIRSAQVARDVALSGRGSRPATYLAMQLSQALNAKRIYQRATRLRDKLVYGLEHRLLRNYEAHIWDKFSRTVLIGQRDVDEIRAAGRERGLHEIDNYLLCAHGVDIDRFYPTPEREEPSTLVFSGVMRTNTNIEAITWFVRHCWPAVKAAVPHVKLYIVGRAPAMEILALAHNEPAITVTGEVADPFTFLSRATVCINPMQAGAGMQNKLIEYFSSGKAVVATPVANEGVGATPGTHFVQAHGVEAFTESTIALLSDADRRAKLGRAARAYIVQEWSWEKHFADLEADMVARVSEGLLRPVAADR